MDSQGDWPGRQVSAAAATSSRPSAAYAREPRPVSRHATSLIDMDDDLDPQQQQHFNVGRRSRAPSSRMPQGQPPPEAMDFMRQHDPNPSTTAAAAASRHAPLHYGAGEQDSPYHSPSGQRRMLNGGRDYGMMARSRRGENMDSGPSYAQEGGYSSAQRSPRPVAPAGTFGDPSPRVGVGIYEDDHAAPLSGNNLIAPSAATLQRGRSQGAPSSEEQEQQLQRIQDQYLSAPYSSLMQEGGPMVGGANHQNNMDAGGVARRPVPNRLPVPFAGDPLPATIHPVEPMNPSSKWSLRITKKKHVRVPDIFTPSLVDSEAEIQQIHDQWLEQQQNEGYEAVSYHIIDCENCGSPLQVKKSAILINCPSCDEVCPVANCITRRK